jgi:predicted nucleotidyltransferase
MTAIAELNRDELIRTLRQLEPALRAKGITGLAIFGSRARRDHRPDSDLDVLVTIENGAKFSLIDLVGVSHIIGDRLGIPANMFMRRSLDPAMAATIRPDIIEVF